MIKKLYLTCLTLGLCVCGFITPTYADQEETWQDACEGDAIRLCFFDIPNKKDITQCLIKKKNKLHDKCHPYIDGLVIDNEDPKGYRRVSPEKSQVDTSSLPMDEIVVDNKPLPQDIQNPPPQPHASTPDKEKDDDSIFDMFDHLFDSDDQDDHKDDDVLDGLFDDI